MDMIFILHADHEQNCSTSAVRIVGSGRVNLYAAISAGIAALWGPLPIEIKRDILRLAAFIDKRIFETMSFPSPEKLNIIIKINQNIAAGLRSSASETT